MFQARHFDNGADVLANAREVARSRYAPRQIAPTQVPSTAKHTANQPLVPAPTPEPQMGSGSTSGDIAASPSSSEVAEWVEAHRESWAVVQQNDYFKSHARAMQIVASMAKEHGVTTDDIFSPARTARLVAPRQRAMAAVYLEFPRWPLTKIGKFFGGRDHTTVLHALKKQNVWRGGQA